MIYDNSVSIDMFNVRSSKGCLAGRPELTPVAKVAGKKVVQRVFKGDMQATASIFPT